MPPAVASTSAAHDSFPGHGWRRVGPAATAVHASKPVGTLHGNAQPCGRICRLERQIGPQGSSQGVAARRTVRAVGPGLGRAGTRGGGLQSRQRSGQKPLPPSSSVSWRRRRRRSPRLGGVGLTRGAGQLVGRLGQRAGGTAGGQWRRGGTGGGRPGIRAGAEAGAGHPGVGDGAGVGAARVGRARARRTRGRRRPGGAGGRGAVELVVGVRPGGGRAGARRAAAGRARGRRVCRRAGEGRLRLRHPAAGRRPGRTGMPAGAGDPTRQRRPGLVDDLVVGAADVAAAGRAPRQGLPADGRIGGLVGGGPHRRARV